jgi:hypothetical protein
VNQGKSGLVSAERKFNGKVIVHRQEPVGTMSEQLPRQSVWSNFYSNDSIMSKEIWPTHSGQTDFCQVIANDFNNSYGLTTGGLVFIEFNSPMSLFTIHESKPFSTILSFNREGGQTMRSSKMIVILFLLAGVVGCSTVYDVQFDYDTKTDFTNLKSYNWLPVPEKADIDSLDVGRVQKAVNAEMQARGLKLTSDNPDFLIAEHLGKEDKVSIRDWGYNYSPYGGYWGGYWGPGGGVSTYQYEEGSLILDFIDPKTKNLIWRGSAKAEVDKSRTAEEREALINEAVQKILKNFPPPAK